MSRDGDRLPDLPPAVLFAALDGCGDGVVLCDSVGRVVLVNAVAAEMLPGVEAGTDTARGPAAELFAHDASPGSGGEVPHGDRPGREVRPADRPREVRYGDRLIRVRGERAGLDHHVWHLTYAGLAGPAGGVAAAFALRAERRRTEFLLDAGRRLSASLNTRRCARATAELATGFLADSAIVLLPADLRRRVEWVRVTAGRGQASARFEEGAVPAADTATVAGLADALTASPHGGVWRLDPAGTPGWLVPEGFGDAGHLMAIPLPGNGAPSAALVLARRAGGPPFDEEDEALARALAVRAGAAIAAATLYREQSDTNAILTGDLLPPDLPDVDGIELAGSLRASEQAGLIGGDFYDVYLPDAFAAFAAEPYPQDITGGAATDRDIRAPLVILGDVCGKGARAAVLAGQVRHSLRTLLLLESRPERLIELLNRALLASPSPNSYVTLVMGALSRAPGGHTRLHLSVAGHPPPLVLRRDGVVERVAIRGSLLGALKNPVLNAVTVDLAPGEVCLFYSDGVTEAFGGPSAREMFGPARLEAALGTCAGMPVAALVERLEQISTEWLAGGEHDDRALLAIRARGASG